MTAADLVAACLQRGISLSPEGDRIRARPAAALTPELAAEVRVNRAELLLLLAESELEVSQVAARDLDGPELCLACGRLETVMLLMAPGQDGRPWHLCGPCWRGAR